MKKTAAEKAAKTKHSPKKILLYSGGFFVGILNGLLGAGGGMLAVPLLKAFKLDTKKSHATSIAVILPLSVLSTFIFIKHGDVKISQALPYIPYGIAGAAVGALVLKKLPDIWIRRIFGAFIIYSSIRLFLQK